MSKFLATKLAALTASAVLLSALEVSAVVLYDNSSIVTGVGNGYNGANTSAVASSARTYGFSDSGIGVTDFLADHFNLPTTSSIQAITFDSYSSNSTYPATPTSPFTGATLSIWSAQPGTAGASVLFTSTTLATTAWTGVYRVSQNALTDPTRPIMSLSMNFAGVTLPAGTYWASWSVTSDVPPGTSFTYSSPVMNPDGTMPPGPSLQSPDGSTWYTLTDDVTGVSNRFPLLVTGQVVPEPGTWAALLTGFGLLSVCQRSRRARVS